MTCLQNLKKPAASKRTNLPRRVDYAREFLKDWARLSHSGLDRLYILSAGWGLIPGDFLTPNYDITFSAAQNVQRFKRRRHR